MNVSGNLGSFSVLDGGYQFVPGAQWVLSAAEYSGFEKFVYCWSSLAADPYLDDVPPKRYRRHAEFIYDRLSRAVSTVFSKPYRQSSDANPLFGDVDRNFARIDPLQLRNTFFTALVDASTKIIGWRSRWVHMHAHMVRVVVQDGSEGHPVPEGLHRDGYQFISIHLVSRINVRGGWTRVVDDSGDEVFREALSAPLDTVYICEERLRHDTSTISPVNTGRCQRDVLLLSYDEVT